jgi:hypothetical protein
MQLVLLEPILAWTILGVIIAAISALVGYRAYLFLKKGIRIANDTLAVAKEQQEHDSYAGVHLAYFPHATLIAALEVSNTGSHTLVLQAVRVTARFQHPEQVEIFSLSPSLSLQAGGKHLISVFPQLRAYYLKHAASQTGDNALHDKNHMGVSFHCASQNHTFDSDWFDFSVTVRQGTVVDAQPVN